MDESNKELVVGKEAVAKLWSLIQAQAAINPNILDNAYFLDPVNRQAKETYSTLSDPIYTIDRWRIEGSSKMYVIKNGIRMSPNNWMQQIIKGSLDQYIGQKMTFSLLHDAGLDSATITINGLVSDNPTSFGGVLRIEPLGSYFGATIYQGNGSTVFKAAKLELGDHQTLAHQENGNWVLNEIPKYSEQYAICKLYDMVTGELIQWRFIGD